MWGDIYTDTHHNNNNNTTSKTPPSHIRGGIFTQMPTTTIIYTDAHHNNNNNTTSKTPPSQIRGGAKTGGESVISLYYRDLQKYRYLQMSFTYDVIDLYPLRTIYGMVSKIL